MQWIDSFLSTYTGPYLLAQVICIFLIYILGIAVLVPGTVNANDRTNIGKSIRLVLSLGFPIGISVLIICGYIFLTVGIPFNVISVTLTLLVLALFFIALGCKKECYRRISAQIKPIIAVAAVLICLLIIMFAVSGYTAMSVSNDSLYYFWQYPRAIVTYGGIRDQFDNFLTDTGLGAAIIGTLPFLYGFGETFGIQEFFHICFIMFIGNAMYDALCENYPQINIKKRVIITVITVALFVVCTPAYVLAHWAMANMYFMEYMFMALYMMFRLQEDNNILNMIYMFMMLHSCAAMRMEGGIFVLLIIISASMLKNRSKWLVGTIVPIMILQGLYEFKIFGLFTIDNPYLFMTPIKAVVQFAMYVVVIVYLLVLRTKFDRVLKNHLPVTYIGILVLANIVLMISDPGHYIANLKAFAGNLYGQSGWGILPYVLPGSLVVIVVLILTYSDYSVKKAKEYFGKLDMNVVYWLFNTIAFVLVTIAVSFERGDNLNIDTGDSGNRVLLQVAPLIIFSIIIWIVDILTKTELIDEGNNE